MSLSGPAREAFSELWLKLARAAARRQVAEIAALAADAQGWRSPLDEPQDAGVLFALARMATAVKRSKTPEEQALRLPVTSQLGLLVLELIGEPAERPEAPALPFRADIDG